MQFCSKLLIDFFVKDASWPQPSEFSNALMNNNSPIYRTHTFSQSPKFVPNWGIAMGALADLALSVMSSDFRPSEQDTGS